MRRMLMCLMACSAVACGGANLVRNPSFEADADGDGVPDEWRWAGDSKLVAQTLTIDKGRDGRRCARLACTRFRAGTPSAHAMLCQMGVPVRRGKVYRVSFWAKGQGIGGEMVSVALSDTSVWANCGLDEAFCPTPQWERHECLFAARRTVGAKSRFQIWFSSAGTLWLDDVVFEEAGDQLRRPGHVIPAKGKRNLVPNASFECGTSGWGSAEWDRATHWGGRMNRLFGTIDSSQRVHGSSSLRIDLSAKNQPVSFFDYYDLRRTPVWAPLAANMGYIEVEPQRPYTFSVYLKAAKPDTPARLAIRQFEGRHAEKAVRVGTDWQRYSLTFTPTKRWCYVLAGPDLRKTDETPDPPREATLWLDALQLERGEKPTVFASRDPFEVKLSLAWRRDPSRRGLSDMTLENEPGNVFAWGQDLWIVRWGCGRAPRDAKVELRVTDFFGREVWRHTGGPGGPSDVLRLGGHLRGFFRLHAKLTAGEVAGEQTLRFAVIPVRKGADSRFGVNHAYPWPHLLDLNRKAGLMWVRDWSLKWQEVEPEKGRFTFVETDYQIDRPRRHGLDVLAMLPFPSSRWTSTASAKMKAARDYRGRREVVAMAPRDVGEFEDYVRRTVAHHKGRVVWWQVFNEPIFTSYALPRKHGYTGADYAKWTRAFVRAARKADAKCKILAGMGYIRGGQIMDDWRQFLAAGGLAGIDAVDIHHYPRTRPPEFIEPLLEELNALMDRYGGRKPIWCTEYGYYADDEPWAVPMPHSGFNRPLKTESLQAAYAVRWATLLCANGVDKIFYHAGTCDGINHDSLQGIFYEYAGQPHKIYAAQAVMSHLLTATCRFVKKLKLGEGIRGYLFRDGARLVAVVWAPRGAKARQVRLASDKLELWDIVGRPQKARQFAPDGTPAYILSDGLSVEAFVSGVLPSGGQVR